MNVLEACRHHSCHHLVYASSSSVYGANKNVPFSENDFVDNPISFYAATKKSNELMAHTYSHLYKIPMTGLRFFTVYGPWGRPDMAPMKFARAISQKQAIDVDNHGDMSRDFTYIADIVEGVVRVLDKPPENNGDTGSAPYRIFNIGRGAPMPLMQFISAMESALGCEAIKRFLPMQAGDVPATAADTQALRDWVGYSPSTTVEEGVAAFIAWYQGYYQG